MRSVQINGSVNKIRMNARWKGHPTVLEDSKLPRAFCSLVSNQVHHINVKMWPAWVETLFPGVKMDSSNGLVIISLTLLIRKSAAD